MSSLSSITRNDTPDTLSTLGYITMQIRFSALTISLILFTLALFCASPSARSVECEEGIPATDVTISSLNGQPEPKKLDLEVQRKTGAVTEAIIDIAVVRRRDWCMRTYFGPLTFTWPNLPEGVTAVFDPVTLEPYSDYKAQKGRVRLSISASVPDGAFPLSIESKENRVRAAPFRIVLSTQSN